MNDAEFLQLSNIVHAHYQNNETVYKMFVALRHAREQLTKWERDASLLMNKLQEGTLHLVYCNDNHDLRVGRKGGICSCPLGIEIKQLRREKEFAEAAAKYYWTNATTMARDDSDWQPSDPDLYGESWQEDFKTTGPAGQYPREDA